MLLFSHARFVLFASWARSPHSTRRRTQGVNKDFLRLLALAHDASRGSWSRVHDGLAQLRASGIPDCPHRCLLEGLAAEHHTAAMDPQQVMLAALQCFLRGLQLCFPSDPDLVRAVFPLHPLGADSKASGSGGGCCECDAHYTRLLRWGQQHRRAVPLVFPFASPVSPLVQPDTPYPGIYGFSQAQELAYRLRPQLPAAGPGDNWIALELAKCYCELLQTAKRRGWMLELTGNQGEQGLVVHL